MAKGLSQGQLGEAMSVSRQTINSIERERYTPSLPLALALAGSVRRRWRRCSMRITRSKWFLPLFAVAGGGVVFVAQWIGCDPRAGLVSFAIVAGFEGSYCSVVAARRFAVCAATAATSASGRSISTQPQSPGSL
jgi:DNA-binding XRE family transcriptional regulator